VITRLANAWGAVRQHPRRALAAVVALAGLGLGGYAAAQFLWPEDPLREAEAALARYDFEAAQQQLAAYLRERPDDAAAHFVAARADRYRGEFARASEHLRLARRLGYPDAAVELEHLLLRTSQHPDPTALAQLRTRASAGGPDTPAILEVLTQAYIDTYQLREAVGALDQLLELRPANVKALLGRGRVKERLFDFGAAAQDYRAALDVDPQANEVRARLAAVLLIHGKPDEAAAEFEGLRQRQGDTPAVLRGLARCRRQQGRLPEAMGLLDRVLAEAPDDAVALTERGKVALELGRPAEAESSLRRAVLLAPHNREARHSLYQCLRLTGPSEEAAAALKGYRQLDADLRRLDKVTSAVVANPADLAMRCEAADLFFRLGEPEEAVRWLRAVLVLDPQHAEAHRALARHFRAAGQPDLAAEHERGAGAP
jgi:Flp pilus assembly protein TadD